MCKAWEIILRKAHTICISLYLHLSTLKGTCCNNNTKTNISLLGTACLHVMNIANNYGKYVCAEFSTLLCRMWFTTQWSLLLYKLTISVYKRYTNSSVWVCVNPHITSKQWIRGWSDEGDYSDANAQCKIPTYIIHIHVKISKEHAMRELFLHSRP